MESSHSIGLDARDRAWLDGLRRRDASAIEAIHDRYGAALLGLAVRILRNRAEAEELLGDVLFELWSHPDRFDPRRGTLSTYLITLTRSRALDRLRKHTRREGIAPTAPVDTATTDGESSKLVGDQSSPHDDAVLAEQRQRIEQALGQLSPEQRAAIELAFYDGLSHTEIARSLGQPLGTVKGRIRGGMIRLRDALRNVYGGAELR